MSKTPFTIFNASAGSGKTYTLVRDYLSILFSHKNPNYFRHVIAITFTNKAAAEMKQRIIDNLVCFSNGKKNEMYKELLTDSKLDQLAFKEKSTHILNAIYTDYSGFNVTTLDSLTHKIVRSFAYEFGLKSDFDIELNSEKILQEAIDRVLSRIGEDDELTQILVNLSISQSDDNKAWDIRHLLFNFSKILLNEFDKKNFEDIGNVSQNELAGAGKDFRKRQIAFKKQLADIGEKALDIISKNDLSEDHFYYKKLPNHFKLLIENPDKTDFTPESTLYKYIAEDTLIKKSINKDDFARAEAILPELLHLNDQAKKIHEQYILHGLWLEGLSPLTLLLDIYQAMQNIKAEKNILFISDFNELIFEKIKDESIPFIYERIGERFNHFFIDEMQDTSVLQWINLVPLIHNELSHGSGSLLLVGDAKQSIYRWRGSYPEQFIGLANAENNLPFNVPKKVKYLDTNYRSHAEIIDFNNQFYSYISSFFEHPLYRSLYELTSVQQTNSKQGGYIQIDFVEVDESIEKQDLIPQKVFETITQLDKDFKPSDVCILVRTHNQSVIIADYLTAQGINIQSSESLLLNSNETINALAEGLRLCYNPMDDDLRVKLLYFLHKNFDIEIDLHDFISQGIKTDVLTFEKYLAQYNIHFSFSTFNQKTIYSGVEYMIRSWVQPDNSDEYLQTFLDYVLDFQSTNGSNLSGFLELWDEQKEKLSINSANQNDAVKILTYHKAKGLQFPVVILPYDLQIDKVRDDKIWYDFDDNEIIHGLTKTIIPVKKDLLKATPKAINLYRDFMSKKQLDNINLLYVATTRAIEQLYIITTAAPETRGQVKTNYFSGLFRHFLESKNLWKSEQITYSFGHKEKVFSDKKNNGCDHSTQTPLKLKKFISNDVTDTQISIATTASQLWDTPQGIAIDYGNLIHMMMASIHTKDDIEMSIFNFQAMGLFKNEDLIQIKSTIENIVNHPELKKCFDPQYKALTEREIYNPEAQETIIPDRIVFFDGKHIGLYDYKTGEESQTHLKQISQYKNVLASMGYIVDESILVYIYSDSIKLVKV